MHVILQWKAIRFTKLKKLSNVIGKVIQQSTTDALKVESHLQLIKKMREQDYEKWLKGEKLDRISLTVLCDMEWKNMSSNKRYNNKTGNVFIIGVLSTRVMNMKVL